jgi:hypothetical protein
MPPWKDSIEAMLMILPPRPPATQVLGHGLAEEEHGLQIGVHHRVPVVLGEVDAVGAADDAGVVDQDVDLAERGDGLVDHALDRLDRAEVGLDRQELAAGGLHQGACVSVGALRPAAAMSAPASASATATAWPRPVLAPVTRATLPSRLNGWAMVRAS